MRRLAPKKTRQRTSMPAKRCFAGKGPGDGSFTRAADCCASGVEHSRGKARGHRPPPGTRARTGAGKRGLLRPGARGREHAPPAQLRCARPRPCGPRPPVRPPAGRRGRSRAPRVGSPAGAFPRRCFPAGETRRARRARQNALLTTRFHPAVYDHSAAQNIVLRCNQKVFAPLFSKSGKIPRSHRVCGGAAAKKQSLPPAGRLFSPENGPKRPEKFSKTP